MMQLSSLKMFVILFIWIIFCMTYSQSQLSQEVLRSVHRLPRNIVPQSYDLTLFMPRVLNNFTYEGQVIIELYAVERSNSIVLNVDELMIHEQKTTLISYEDKCVPILSQQWDEVKQFYVILFNGELEVRRNYSLTLFFTGEIRDDVFGFYRSVSQVGNDISWMAVTQFSSIFARRAFPCFDEPYLKATFTLRIGHYAKQLITSNTLIEKIEVTNTTDYFLTSMKTTPRMSTYLLGWAVHEFSYLQLPNEKIFKMWTRKSMQGKGLLALEKGWLIFSALQSWFEVQNPIKKMEHVAVPDFNFNAMENWGMITFRESVVLHDKNVTPTKSIHEGFSTMAHEYAHTWFGNLVTPEFWNVAWLKEGFATYFSYFGRSLVDPNLRLMDLFVVENMQEVFRDDAVDHNRTMNGKGSGEAEDAMGFLDFSAYKKGAAIIRMVEQIMGEKSFQTALKSYLTDKSFDFATPSMLYAHLQNYTQTSGTLGTHIDIAEVIESYANQPGYPLVTITRNYSSNLIQISQERFYQNPDASTVKPSQWWVPLNLASTSQRASDVSTFGIIWLGINDKKMMIEVDIDPLEWVICDIDKAGYYRVNYDETNWNMLIIHLGSEGFSAIDQVARATLIDDAFNLARGGYINYSIPFQLVNYLNGETDYVPWLAAVNSFDFLNHILQDLPALRGSLQDHVKRLLEPIYQSLTFFENEEDQLRVKLLRNLILSTACEVKNVDCLDRANSIFRNWILNSSQRIKPDLKSFVYCIGIRSGTADDWERVFSKFIEEDLHTEKVLLITGLGCSNNSALINKLIECFQ